jgi:hypothetical protein
MSISPTGAGRRSEPGRRSGLQVRLALAAWAESFRERWRGRRGGRWLDRTRRAPHSTSWKWRPKGARPHRREEQDEKPRPFAASITSGYHQDRNGERKRVQKKANSQKSPVSHFPTCPQTRGTDRRPCLPGRAGPPRPISAPAPRRAAGTLPWKVGPVRTLSAERVAPDVVSRARLHAHPLLRPVGTVRWSRG